MTRIRVLIADDTRLIRRLLTMQLSAEADLEVVGEAETGEQAVELAGILKPDVVLMDLDMPKLNGAEATEQITRRFPKTRVIFLTSHENLAPMGKLSGAADYFGKGCTPQEVVAAVRRVATAPPPDGNAPAAALPPYENAVGRLARQARLTDRERRVIQRLLDTNLTLQQVARALSQETGENVTESAVKHTMARAMDKLGLEPRTRAALVKLVLETQGRR